MEEVLAKGKLILTQEKPLPIVPGNSEILNKSHCNVV